jgi:hypothetical protein
MTTEELIKSNAILIHEQRSEIDKLKSIIQETLSILECSDEYFEFEYEMENLPTLVSFWIDKAKDRESNIESFFDEMRNLKHKYKFK